MVEKTENMNAYPQLDIGIQFRFNKINSQFIVKIREKGLIMEELSKYIAIFD